MVSSLAIRYISLYHLYVLTPHALAVAARNATLNGVTLMLLAATNDEYVGSSILHNGGPFGSETLSMFLQHIKPGTTVVDAGW
jgi:hypothetical protein